MVTINNDDNNVDNEILQNPTPLEIKEQMANLKINGKKKEGGDSDQENQKPSSNGSKKMKPRKQQPRISLTPFYSSRAKRPEDGKSDLLAGIVGVKDYSPFEKKDPKIRRKVDNDEIEPTEKLFVGKLPMNLTEEDLMRHFSQFGMVTEAIIKDQRGFGFVSFSSISEADAALDDKNHMINEVEIEVKRAMPNRFQSNNQQQNPPEEIDQRSYIMEPFASPMTYNPHIVYPSMFLYPPPPIVAPPVSTVTNSTLETSTPPNEQDKPLEECSTSARPKRNQNDNQKKDETENDLKQQKKLFIGGLHWKTQDSDLREYFSKKGTVTDAMVIMEPNTQRSRGFGFVVFSNAEDAENVFEVKGHEINGKVVDVKRAISKDDDTDNGLAHVPVDKIFVGGIRKDTSKDSLVQFFQKNFGGKVTRVDMKVDESGQNRGFAFLTFDSTAVVENICQNKFHRIGSHLCEVKKAHSKENHHDNNNEYNKQNGYSYTSNYNYYPSYGNGEPYYIPAPAQTFMGYIPHAYAPAMTHPVYDSSGDYIGGTWYPKQQNENEDMSTSSSSYIPQTIYYPALTPTPYPGSPYPYPSYPAAYVPTQKDI